MENNSVGKRIAQLRKQNGWSQMDLAKKINVSDKAVSKWENGGMPSVDLLPRLSKIFNVSIDYLLLGEDNSNSAKELDESEEPSDDDSSSDDMTEFKDSIESLGTRELQIILSDQKDLYTEKEFRILEERYDELMGENSAKELQKKLRIVKPSPNYVCPKCNGINDNPGQYCEYCGYKFFDSKSEDNSSIGCIGYIVAFFLPLIGLIWGLIKDDKEIITFSIVMIVLEVIGAIISAIFYSSALFIL